VAEPEAVRIPAGDLGELVLTFYPDWHQFIVGFKRPVDTAPMAQDDFFVDDTEGLVNPTVEMLENELREGLESRGRRDLAPFAPVLAKRFALEFPDRLGP
jgi:hypothetical protein